MDTATESPAAIVVIDDDFETRKLLTFVLESHGYRVFAAASGKEGLVLSSLYRPQAITLDLCLPDMKGVDVLSALKSSGDTRDIPVIVISASTELMSCGDRQLSFRVIRKPFEVEELEETMASSIHADKRMHVRLRKAG